MGQVVVVSAAIQRQWGKGRTRAKHLRRDAVHGSWDSGLWAGRVPRMVGHYIREALHLTGGVVARQRVVHTAEGGARGARGGHKWEIDWGLSLRRRRPLREEVIVPSWAVVLTLIICRSKNIFHESTLVKRTMGVQKWFQTLRYSLNTHSLICIRVHKRPSPYYISHRACYT